MFSRPRSRSIPARKNAASAKVVAPNRLLAPFASEEQSSGQAYPPAVGPVSKVRNAELAVAKEWSAVIANQTSPGNAANKAVSNVNSAIAQR